MKPTVGFTITLKTFWQVPSLHNLATTFWAIKFFLLAELSAGVEKIIVSVLQLALAVVKS